MQNRLRKCCPECNSLAIMRRSKKHMDNPREKKNYLCPDCGHEFDEPQRRYMKLYRKERHKKW